MTGLERRFTSELSATLVRIDPPRGFLEESPMLGMRRWCHERTLEPRGDGTRLTDHLVFEPRLAGPVVAWFVGVLFRHRHRVLRRAFGGSDGLSTPH